MSTVGFSLIKKKTEFAMFGLGWQLDTFVDAIERGSQNVKLIIQKSSSF